MLPFSELERASKAAYNNRETIGKATVCGCYYCLQEFPPQDVNEWTSDDSALCPRCGIDSVIPDTSGLPLDRASLQAMHARWFGAHIKPPRKTNG